MKLYFLLLVVFTVENCIGQNWVGTQPNFTFGPDRAEAVTSDAVGNVYTAGYLSSPKYIYFSKHSSTGQLIKTEYLRDCVSGGSATEIKYFNGFIYVVGSFTSNTVASGLGGANINDNTGATINLFSNGSYDCFIAKLDPSDMRAVWIKSFGGSGSDIAKSFDINTTGEVFIGGAYSSTVDFDMNNGVVNVPANGTGQDCFLAKYTEVNTTLNINWLHIIGGANNNITDIINSVKLDGLGNVYAAGKFQGANVVFGNGITLSSTPYVEPSNGNSDIQNTDGFFTKINTATAAVSWARKLGSGGDDEIFDIETSLGLVYVSGSFGRGVQDGAEYSSQRTIDFDFGPSLIYRSAIGGGDGFLACYTADQTTTFLWVKQLLGTGGTDVLTTIFLSGSRIYATGNVSSNGATIDGGNPSISSKGGQDVAILGFNATDGSNAKAISVGGPGNDYGLATAVTSNGDKILVAGSFMNTVNFDPVGSDPNFIRVASSDDPFVVQYELNGILPVIISELSAVVKEQTVVLNWRTDNEQNNKGFNIQRYNGSAWSNVGFVAGAGNSTTPKDYSFTDIPKQSGTVLYRLEQVDFDGKKTLSNVVKVDMGALKFKAEAYPNPSSTQTSVAYALPEDAQVLLQLFDSKGQLVKTVVSEKQKAGYHLPMIYTSAMAKGVYYYKLQAGKHKAEGKLIVQ